MIPYHVDRLKEAMQRVQYQPTRTKQQQSTRTFVHKDLQSCTRVIRRDAQKPPLQATYDSPFRVIDRKERCFVVALNNWQDTVTIDRLKPVYTTHTSELLTEHSDDHSHKHLSSQHPPSRKHCTQLSPPVVPGQDVEFSA